MTGLSIHLTVIYYKWFNMNSDIAITTDKRNTNTMIASAKDSAKDMVNGVVDLISLPEIYLRVNQLIEDPEHNAQQLGELIGHDPALTARVLRIVNSAYYALAVKVELVSRAIPLLGEDELRNLVLATSTVETLARIPNQLLNINQFWQHSIYTGIIARLLARHCNILHGERLFIAGMLHDIGKLILYYKEPQLSEQVLIQAAEANGMLYQAEKAIIGFTHAAVGGALMEAWGLPDTLKEIITYHHTPLNAKLYPLETAILHIADAIVNSLEPGAPVDEHLLENMIAFEPETLNVIGLDLTILPALMEKAGEQAAAVMKIICPNG